ncbi:MAG: hypothetical protein R2911_02465 [Caldilineaceae bacterium]
MAVNRDPASSTLYAAWVNRTSDGGRVVFSKSINKGESWSALRTVSGGAGEGYAFFQGLDVAPNGRIDLAYQAQVASNPNTWGADNAQIDSWYVQSTDGVQAGPHPPRSAAHPLTPPPLPRTIWLVSSMATITHWYLQTATPNDWPQMLRVTAFAVWKLIYIS